MADTAPSAPATPPAPTSLWETIFTSTPVLLAVVSTFLAGQSSTEMSLAQYHRAMSAQQQSKAGDQWNFFQAKRIRGTQNETAADHLFATAVPAPIDAARLRESADFLADAAGKIEADLRSVPGGVGGLPLAEAQKSSAELAVLLNNDGKPRPDVEAAFRHVNPPYARLKGDRFENPEIRVELQPIRDQAVNRVAKAIGERKTESETLADVSSISQDTLDAAIETAERNAAAFDAWGRTIAGPLAGVDEWVKRHARLATGLLRSLEERRDAADAAGDLKAAAELVAPLKRAEAAERRAQRLVHDLVQARAAFTAWRYAIEANFNQRSASLFEVQVRRSSWEAGVHIRRCWGYFYGQLAVQAAVTVATLALALRRKSGVWILACVTSIGGLMYAVGVFLNAVPVPGA